MTTPRGLALCVTVALVASACSATGAETTTTALVSETEAGGASPPGSLMNRALGGTQTVQDFVIHIDMSVQTDDGAVSFYEEVLEAALSNAGEAVPLAGGFTFAPVDSLEGELVDADGEVVPTIAVDFGMFSATETRLEEAGNLLAQDLRAAGNVEVAELIEGDDSDEAQMLVEIITADYAQRRTHAGPGDKSAIDITFVDSVAPGDPLTSTYLFGQTLPGDPAIEAGLSAHELFAYRWNQGLIAILGEEDGVTTVTDDTVVAVEGSTIMTREAKRALLAVVKLAGADAGLEAAEDLLDRSSDGDFESAVQRPILPHIGPVEVFKGAILCQVGSVCAGRYISAERFKLYYATLFSSQRCAQVAAGLNARNEAGGIPVSELGIDASGGGGDPAEGDPAEGDPAEDPPGPVGCDPPPGPAPKPPSGHVWGDPHVRTIDGNRYDNMAVGEFLLFDNGVATIQMRTEPWPGEDSVSLATAFAFRIGDHIVSVHRGDQTWIDGDRTELTRGETVEIGGGELLWWVGGWVIVWPDGTVARVTDATSALLIVVTPSSQTSQGLLGDNDGDPGNDLVTGAGVQLGPDADDDFATFYPTYIDSWRISAEESLFHYEAGESHGSFDLEGFPARPFTDRNLSEAVRADAEAVCREVGVTMEEILEACIVDVGLTGDQSFAYQSYLIEASTPDDTSRREPETAAPRPSVDGASIVRVGDLTVKFGPDPPIQDPNGFSPRWQCAVTEGSFHASSRFVETSTRTFELRIEYVDAATSATGEERFSTVIMLNGEDHAWVLNYVEHFSDSIESISLDGSTLEVHGSAFRDESFDPGLSPFSQLPGDVELQPFSLVATCDQ